MNRGLTQLLHILPEWASIEILKKSDGTFCIYIWGDNDSVIYQSPWRGLSEPLDEQVLDLAKIFCAHG